MSKATVTVPERLDGGRADKVLSELLGCSRSVARAIIDASDATVEGRALKASEKVRAGMVLIAEVPVEDRDLVPDPDVAFGTVYVDDDLVIVDKPAGLVVHPGSGHRTGTLVNGLIARFPDIIGVGQEGRWGIVHRLDRDTSGLLVVARSQSAYDRLVEMMKAREVSRRYLSLVNGEFTNTVGTIDAPIGRDPQNPTRMYLSRVGKPARTHYRRLATWHVRDATLVSVTLETGRTHQIRVHMRSIGHPIIGDRVYGRRGVVGDPGRPWLHARQLGFEHPITSAPLEFLAPLPDDLSDSLVVLGEPDSGETADINGESL